VTALNGYHAWAFTRTVNSLLWIGRQCSSGLCMAVRESRARRTSGSAAKRPWDGWDRIWSHRHPVPGVAVSHEQAPGATEWQSSQLAHPNRSAAPANSEPSRWGRCWRSKELFGSL
jgi:hypothetical protein